MPHRAMFLQFLRNMKPSSKQCLLYHGVCALQSSSSLLVKHAAQTRKLGLVTRLCQI
ncbi:hypothetical protein U0070_018627 [Myodes glareolus]|uniref:Uncharacterized protein n=1 Tax=Myodes glareolus TaxID=447135 RepID=A0AAW0ITT8_MYOGA